MEELDDVEENFSRKRIYNTQIVGIQVNLIKISQLITAHLKIPKDPLSLKRSLLAHYFFPIQSRLLLDLAGDHSSKNCNLKKELLSIALIVRFMVGKIVYFATVVATRFTEVGLFGV
jgi:hypothetical protein